MEAAPPSYEKATLIDFWDIVARYMPSNDLCSASLVCSRWHTTFAPHIWGNPASHFGLENDRVYVALTRFKRTLQTARLLVRSMTHTLHLPPAHAEIYNGPHADWLRDVMERLPNLQSLIVRGLPFFDYAALQALVLFRKKSEDRRAPPSGVIELPGSSGSFFQSPTTTIPSFGLRLLDASRCPNVTSSGLAAALGRFEGLLYLDLSFSYPARDPAVLETLRKFSGLQVLKLRGVSLKDESIEVLGKAIGVRVRSLDVRDNQLTDRGVRTLLEYCFVSNTDASNGFTSLASGQRSPTLLPYLGSEMLEIYQGEDFEGYLRSAFTGRFVSRLAIEDAPAGGITHLYIAGNMVTVEGLSGLVRAQRLHVLDIGPVAAARVRHHSFSGGEQESSVTMPGVEKLTPVFAKHAADALTFLRVDHGLITKDAPQSHPEEVVQGRAELGDTSLPYIPSHAAELPANTVRPETFELPTDQQTPRFELEADPITFAISPAADDTYKIETPQEPDKREDTFKIVDDGSAGSPNEARRGSALAPEVVDTLTNNMQNTMLSPVSAMGEGTMMSMNGIPSPIALDSPNVSPPRTPRPRSYSSIATERKARLNAHVLAGRNLHPAMLPHISTLVLTDVPPFSQDRDAADRIICFIKQCAEEASLARKQAELDYSAPPGRKGHATALKHSADKFFALKRLVLEMAPEGGRPKGKASQWLNQETRSVTEDRDSESLWNAASTDFSFFGEEENMFPTLETGRFAGSGATEKEVNFGQPIQAPVQTRPAPPPRIDNIALLSAFRRDRKLAHQRAVAAARNADVQVEGLWDGVVQVVRSNMTIRSDEEMDYYGNKFINNYLYR
ncbi:hypothetical protein HII31_12861 [Pseudocercospora fuligena]|uniref:F-box domain-containing protein n=1 Tax=Pseudocercospora fuligena TaxID=685502 RepID=A0A8H6VF04_9PEZI|nr:hypothetical protein HII31_12861 [Pseudocercospora fuligena]